MPKLSGVVQIEETYFRENQRGAIELVNLVPTAVKERKPRLEITHILSELGFFRPELACVVTGILRCRRSFSFTIYGRFGFVSETR